MHRRHWLDLPTSVRRAVEHHTGWIERVEPVVTGSVSDLVVALHASNGVYFCKGVHESNPLAWMHRNEARLNPHLDGITARLRWQVEHDGWLLLGFDHVPGRHPDLAPGSGDLPAVAAALAGLASALTPCPPVAVQSATVRWAGRIDPAMVDGDTLAHTDVTPRNFLIGGATGVVVDWSMPCRGAAWIDTARMVVRLVSAGHSPTQAEAWAATVPAWRAAPPGSLDAFADTIAALTRERQQQSAAPHLPALAAAAEAWSRHRDGERRGG